MLLVAQPALMLRLVGSIVPLPRWSAPLVVVGGYLVAVIGFYATNRSTPAVLFLVGYFFVAEFIAAALLIAEGRRRLGFPRVRLDRRGARLAPVRAVDPHLGPGQCRPRWRRDRRSGDHPDLPPPGPRGRPRLSRRLRPATLASRDRLSKPRLRCRPDPSCRARPARTNASCGPALADAAGQILGTSRVRIASVGESAVHGPEHRVGIDGEHGPVAPGRSRLFGQGPDPRRGRPRRRPRSAPGRSAAVPRGRRRAHRPARLADGACGRARARDGDAGRRRARSSSRRLGDPRQRGPVPGAARRRAERDAQRR